MVHALRFAALLAALLSSVLSAQQVNEYYVKAAYVYNLTKFVEWPPQVFKNGSDSIVICVLGQSPIQEALLEAVKGEKIDGRTLLVHQLPAAEQVRGCHLLFIAASDRKRTRSILEDLKAAGTLTVGEAEDFLDEGGAVNFKLEGSRVRIEVNLNAVERHGLRISPKLLSLARVVRK
jgi:hypothetical protein